MKIDLQSNEHIIKEGSANLFRGIEAVGGKLFLTNQRLFFSSHALNIQTKSLDIPILNLKETQLSWSTLFGIVPLIPNAMIVTTGSGEAYKFVVYGRKEWKLLIDKSSNPF